MPSLESEQISTCPADVKEQMSRMYLTGQHAGHGQAAACPRALEDEVVPVWNQLWSSQARGWAELARHSWPASHFGETVSEPS